MASPVCPPNVVANPDVGPTASPTTIDVTLSRPTPPSASGTSMPSRPSSPARPSSARATRPVLRLQGVERRQHFLGDEFARGLRDQPMFRR